MLAVNENGGSDSCRQKVIEKLHLFLDTIPEDAGEGERLQKLSAFFAKVAYATEKFGDNFALDNFIERGHGDPKTRDMQCLDYMLCGNDEGVMLLEAIRDEMAKSPLAQVNGTSLEFQRCAAKCKDEEIRLANAHRLMDQVHEHPEFSIGRG